MELGQLEAFESAARRGSFTLAGEELGLTQPSVSARIAGLEQILGGPLFERGGRQLTLTQLGKAFLPYTERALAAIDDGAKAVRRHIEGKTGYLTMAALDLPAQFMLPKPLMRFRKAYSFVDTSIVLRTSPEIIASLMQGTVSLGLIGTRLYGKGVDVHGRFIEPIHAYVAPSHPLAQAQNLVVGDLYSHTIYLTTLNRDVTATISTIVEHARPGSGGAVLRLPAIMLIPFLVQGEGVAFLPESAVKTQVETGELMPLTIGDLPPLMNELLLISIQGRELDAPTQAFVQMFRAEWYHLLVD
ncbi:LysR family transcriptional regulator [Phototrophicus methaneseepsis]|uniref:LysR family transcriptional regulator n=1 Tax=Phototrophicus methaneseepsis TaxID=2710758 RepID=A0A7S8ECV2_9CHLR|nr:LysR family transcriptional regulator [Phototrophicus methaneseepsis]QPC84633.1 LysR family transcriptional regulator [Phototrophicus methaneseepsis]